jgi:ATP-dependent Lon protease
MATITDQDKPAAEAPQFPELPEDAIIVVPVRNFVLFPDVVMPLSINRPISVAAAQAAVQGSRPIGVLTQRDAGIDTPTGNDMHRMGTLANVLRYVTADEAHHLIVQGESRFRVVEFLDGWPFLVARIEQVAEVDPKTPEIEARMINLRKQALETVALLPQAPQGLSEAIQNIPTASTLADTVAAYIDIDPAQKQELLETVALDARLEKISRHLEQRLQVLRLSAEIGKDVQETLTERQREHILREQMAAIQRQLGEDDGKSAEIAELTEKIAKAAMPPEVEKEATKELRRLERMPEGAADRAALGTAGSREGDRHQPGARDPRRGSLRPRQDQAADHRISRRAQARARREGADPVLRRASGRRQDVARPVDRARHGPAVHARQPGRRA